MKPIRLIAILFFWAAAAQEVPPLLKFSAESYQAGNQNWMIGQDSRQFIYSANNEGLLEFNGSEWTHYPSPNETIIRSVKVIGETVFTGAYMEFGQWKRDNHGKLRYTSLSDGIKSKLVDDEQFWNILGFDHWMIFQSLNRIYIYDTKAKTFKIVSAKDQILKVFKTVSSIYYQPVNDGIYELENGKSKLVVPASQLAGRRVVNLFQTESGLLLITHNDGFHLFAGGKLIKAFPSADAFLKGTTTYSAIRLTDGCFALGSISNGLYITHPDGRLKWHLTQDRGLSNNTILSLFEDKDHNLWMGLDNGIDCLNMASPLRSYSDNTGMLGTVYASAVHGGMLYIGTNQGLFCRSQNTSDFKFVTGTKGQVWSLEVYDGTLFCGHDSGTFLVSGDKAINIYSESGTWKFKRNPSNPDELIQGNYSGLSVLKKTPAGWAFKSRIPGFAYSCRFFEPHKGKIYMSHEYKGVFELAMTPDYSKVTGFKVLENPKKGKNAGLVAYNGQILYANREGVYRLRDDGSFAKDSLYSTAYTPSEYTSGKLIVDSQQRLWIFTRDRLNCFSSGKLSDTPKRGAIPIPSSLTKSMQGYENIALLRNDNYLVGTTDGFYTFNINRFSTSVYNVNITAIEANKSNAPSVNVALTPDESVPYAQNNLTFRFSVPEFNKYTVAEYSYRLLGLEDTWSPWSDKANVSYKNLRYGDYTFVVRGRIGDKLSANEARYEFTILRPWYFSWIAIFCYVILFTVLGLIVHRMYKSYYQKQKDKLIADNKRQLEMKELESAQVLMQLKNEQLLQDVENKNRELAASTMNLIKKNEFLAQIKEDLKKTSDDSRNIKNVISTINRNISEEDTWDLFKEAFNNADKDFLRTIKQLHPSLTPNDLRLCAYLRLNLSSKEIAPLLNISVRSVEIKRYRLRKKMDLPHEQGLVEYILAV